MTEQELTTRRLYELSRSVREYILETTFGEPSEEVSVKLDHYLELMSEPDSFDVMALPKAFGPRPRHWYFLVSERKFHVGQMLMRNGLAPVLRPVIPLEVPKRSDHCDHMAMAFRYANLAVQRPHSMGMIDLGDTLKEVEEDEDTHQKTDD